MTTVGPLFGAMTRRDELMAAHPNTQERFVVWLSLCPDGLYHEFIGWIMRSAAGFRKERGIGRDLFDDQQQRDFTAWLWEHGAEYVGGGK